MRGREFDIIERYFSGRVPHEADQVVLGPGDDCAILRVRAGKELCVSMDTLISGVHFPLDASGRVAAHRSLAANLSDLAAMGAECFASALALTLPREDAVWLDDFSATLSELVSRHDIPLVGGNLARGELSVTITVLGTLPIGKSLRRSGARVDDDIYVSGNLGDAGGGLALLRQGEDQEDELVRRYRYPEPRLELGKALLDVASAAIDISDGLAADLGHICESSKVGAVVNVEKILLSPALTKRFGRDQAQHFALSAGDDYELCFTAPTNQREDIAQLARRLDLTLTRIGSIVPEQGVAFLDAKGASMEIAEPGYQHFHES